MMSAPQPLEPALAGLLMEFIQHTKDYAVICMDPDGKVTGWLGASPEVFGYEAEDTLGETLTKIFVPEDKARHIDRFELRIASTDSRAEDDRWHVRKDGTRIWATGTATAMRREDGTLAGFVKVVRDRTDLRTQIEFLEQQTQTLVASRERTHLFIKTLGHELRNPLAPLNNALEIIRRVADDPKLEGAFQIIARQVTALTRLADDLMDITRLETGKAELDLKPADLRRILSDAVASLRNTAEERKVRLEAVLPEAPLPVAIDEGRFQRLVLNLLNNALKYTPEGGSVWVKGIQEGAEALIRVEDTGIGIAPEVLPRIFELFTRERDAVGRVPSGLGIGLTMVREIAELHGGSVQARSSGVGKGAEFTVRLPAVATPAS